MNILKLIFGQENPEGENPENINPETNPKNTAEEIRQKNKLIVNIATLLNSLQVNSKSKRVSLGAAKLLDKLNRQINDENKAIVSVEELNNTYNSLRALNQNNFPELKNIISSTLAKLVSGTDEGKQESEKNEIEELLADIVGYEVKTPKQAALTTEDIKKMPEDKAKEVLFRAVSGVEETKIIFKKLVDISKNKFMHIIEDQDNVSEILSSAVTGGHINVHLNQDEIRNTIYQNADFILQKIKNIPENEAMFLTSEKFKDFISELLYNILEEEVGKKEAQKFEKSGAKLTRYVAEETLASLGTIKDIIDKVEEADTEEEKIRYLEENLPYLIMGDSVLFTEKGREIVANLFPIVNSGAVLFAYIRATVSEILGAIPGDQFEGELSSFIDISKGENLAQSFDKAVKKYRKLFKPKDPALAKGLKKLTEQYKTDLGMPKAAVQDFITRGEALFMACRQNYVAVLPSGEVIELKTFLTRLMLGNTGAKQFKIERYDQTGLAQSRNTAVHDALMYFSSINLLPSLTPGVERWSYVIGSFSFSKLLRTQLLNLAGINLTNLIAALILHHNIPIAKDILLKIVPDLQHVSNADIWRLVEFGEEAAESALSNTKSETNEEVAAMNKPLRRYIKAILKLGKDKEYKEYYSPQEIIDQYTSLEEKDNQGLPQRKKTPEPIEPPSRTTITSRIIETIVTKIYDKINTVSRLIPQDDSVGVLAEFKANLDRSTQEAIISFIIEYENVTALRPCPPKPIEFTFKDYTFSGNISAVYISSEPPVIAEGQFKVKYTGTIEGLVKDLELDEGNQVSIAEAISISPFMYKTKGNLRHIANTFTTLSNLTKDKETIGKLHELQSRLNSFASSLNERMFEINLTEGTIPNEAIVYTAEFIKQLKKLEQLAQSDTVEGTVLKSILKDLKTPQARRAKLAQIASNNVNFDTVNNILSSYKRTIAQSRLEDYISKIKNEDAEDLLRLMVKNSHQIAKQYLFKNNIEKKLSDILINHDFNEPIKIYGKSIDIKKELEKYFKNLKGAPSYVRDYYLQKINPSIDIMNDFIPMIASRLNITEIKDVNKITPEQIREVIEEIKTGLSEKRKEASEFVKDIKEALESIERKKYNSFIPFLKKLFNLTAGETIYIDRGFFAQLINLIKYNNLISVPGLSFIEIDGQIKSLEQLLSEGMTTANIATGQYLKITFLGDKFKKIIRSLLEKKNFITPHELDNFINITMKVEKDIKQKKENSIHSQILEIIGNTNLKTNKTPELTRDKNINSIITKRILKTLRLILSEYRSDLDSLESFIIDNNNNLDLLEKELPKKINQMIEKITKAQLNILAKKFDEIYQTLKKSYSNLKPIRNRIKNSFITSLIVSSVYRNLNDRLLSHWSFYSTQNIKPGSSGKGFSFADIMYFKETFGEEWEALKDYFVIRQQHIMKLRGNSPESTNKIYDALANKITSILFPKTTTSINDIPREDLIELSKKLLLDIIPEDLKNKLLKNIEEDIRLIAAGEKPKFPNLNIDIVKTDLALQNKDIQSDLVTKVSEYLKDIEFTGNDLYVGVWFYLKSLIDKLNKFLLPIKQNSREFQKMNIDPFSKNISLDSIIKHVDNITNVIDPNLTDDVAAFRRIIILGNYDDENIDGYEDWKVSLPYGIPEKDKDDLAKRAAALYNKLLDSYKDPIRAESVVDRALTYFFRKYNTKSRSSFGPVSFEFKIKTKKEATEGEKYKEILHEETEEKIDRKRAELLNFLSTFFDSNIKFMYGTLEGFLTQVKATIFSNTTTNMPADANTILNTIDNILNDIQKLEDIKVIASKLKSLQEFVSSNPARQKLVGGVNFLSPITMQDEKVRQIYSIYVRALTSNTNKALENLESEYNNLAEKYNYPIFRYTPPKMVNLENGVPTTLAIDWNIYMESIKNIEASLTKIRVPVPIMAIGYMTYLKQLARTDSEDPKVKEDPLARIKGYKFSESDLLLLDDKEQELEKELDKELGSIEIQPLVDNVIQTIINSRKSTEGNGPE